MGLPEVPLETRFQIKWWLAHVGSEIQIVRFALGSESLGRWSARKRAPMWFAPVPEIVWRLAMRSLGMLDSPVPKIRSLAML